MLKLLAPLLIAPLLLEPAAIAQVPVDQAVRFTTDTVFEANPFGIDVVDAVTGTLSAVTGLSGKSASPSCGVLDPASGALWTAGSTTVPFEPGSVFRVALAGTAATAVEHALMGATVTAIDIDGSGDLFVAEVTRIVRVDRETGAQTTWDSLPIGGNELYNALTIDPDGERMWAATASFSSSGPTRLLQYDLTAGPSAGAQIDTLTPLSTTATGVAYDGMDNLYLTAGVGSASGLLRHDLAGGSTTAIGALAGTTLNGVRYHRREQRLHMVGGVADQYFLYEPGTAQLTNLGAQVIDAPADVAVNDWLDRTTAFPRRVSAAAPFTLEATAHAFAGEPAGVALTKIDGVPLSQPVIVGGGAADAGGFVATVTAVPAGLLPAGSVLTLQSARLDGATGQVVFGDEATVEYVP